MPFADQIGDDGRAARDVLAPSVMPARRPGVSKAHHRVVRSQAPSRPGLSAHFGLFALVSSARDSGSGRTEASMLVDHLRFWVRVLGEFVPTKRPRLTWSVFDSPVVADRIQNRARRPSPASR